MKNSPPKIRCVIADDHSIFRMGLIQLLEILDVAVVGEAANGKELVDLVDLHRPDIAIVDIEMPVMGGIEASAKINRQYPDVGIIALTMHAQELVIVEMLAAGAKSYLLKDITKIELEEAIMAVAKKQYYFPQSSTFKLFELMQTKNIHPFPKKDILFTQQEMDIIRLICKGFSTKNIADLMFLSKRTIETHRARIMEKMGVSNVASVVAYSYLHLLTPKNK